MCGNKKKGRSYSWNTSECAVVVCFFLFVCLLWLFWLLLLCCWSQHGRTMKLSSSPSKKKRLRRKQIGTQSTQRGRESQASSLLSPLSLLSFSHNKPHRFGFGFVSCLGLCKMVLFVVCRGGEKVICDVFFLSQRPHGFTIQRVRRPTTNGQVFAHFVPFSFFAFPPHAPSSPLHTRTPNQPRWKW